MRPFEHPNMDNFKCPICGTNEDKPVVLVGISGTEEGCNIRARQYHLGCIELMEEIHQDNEYGDFAEISMYLEWKGDNDANN
jgi:hypothetical protein